MSFGTIKGNALNTPNSSSNPVRTGYSTIASVLRARIQTGHYQHGSRLPSEADLADEFNVARLTVRRALEVLALQKTVVRRPGPGHGTRVNWPSADQQDKHSMWEQMHHLGSLDDRTEVQVLSADLTEADPAIAEALACPLASRVLRIVRRRLVDGQPYSLFVTHLREEVGLRINDHASEAAVVKLLEALGHSPTRADQVISACLADETSARLLKCRTGDALLNVQRIALDHDLKPLEFISIFYRPSRYNFHMSLERDDGNDVSFWRMAAPV